MQSESTSFDGKHRLTYTDTGKSHIYKLDGKRVPGATTVGSCYPKGEGLIRWMIQQGIEEFDSKAKLNKAGAIGRVVHKYAECQMMQKPFNWALVDEAEDSEVIRDCIRQYDERASKFPDDKPYAAELLVASPSLAVASQIDLVKYRDGQVIITDYKTGKKIYISALHQTVLYRRMLREWLDIQADVLEILKFGKEGARFETCIVDKDSLTINDVRFEYKGLLDELESQTVRNIQTHSHVRTVEKILNDYYKDLGR